MFNYPLQFLNGHLFMSIGNDRYLVDTGAPTSFGTGSPLTIADRPLQLGDQYLGLDAENLSRYMGVQATGLLGVDALRHFDILMDLVAGSAMLTEGTIESDGFQVHFEAFMGIPVVVARVGGSDRRMFFDTGAQLSYLRSDLLQDSPAAGSTDDFYPGLGSFRTDTFRVEVGLNGLTTSLRCGQLPAALDMLLGMADTEGIIGNEILAHRRAGFFPRRRLLAFANT